MPKDGHQKCVKLQRCHLSVRAVQQTKKKSDHIIRS